MQDYAGICDNIGGNVRMREYAKLYTNVRDYTRLEVCEITRYHAILYIGNMREYALLRDNMGN